MVAMAASDGFILLGGFWVAMVILTYVFANKKEDTRKEFLVAQRSVSWWVGGGSIAASWIWAGALFVSTQQSYEKGLAGLFWFLVPNVIALLIFSFLGPRIRERFERGYTLPQYIGHRLGSNAVHTLYLIPFFFGQLIAIIFNMFAGATVMSLLTGIPITVLMPLLAFISLSYTLVSGMRASVVTDFIQMIMILAGVFLIVPWAVSAAGGIGAIVPGLDGVTHTSGIFDPTVAFTFGIVTSIGLISQTISDQQYWQRVFSINKRELPKAFATGAVLFAIVPLGLSLLGFIAANPAMGIAVPAGSDSSMIGVAAVGHLLPGWAMAVFVIMLLAGLTSTMDSGMVAASSLWVTDVVKYTERERAIITKELNGIPLSTEEDMLAARKLEKRAVQQTRLAMAGITLIALAVGYASYFIAGFGLTQLFLMAISIAASISVPTVLSLYWDGLRAKGVLIGSGIAIAIGMPAFIYFNWANNTAMVVASSVFMLAISAAGCLLAPRLERLWDGWKDLSNKSKR
ncbi:MAG: hypothetical protein NT051_00375 [Candidatus Micrarchaeota archaeon]|nr:hypothetical protein [Candidatus Micrarchaeota archaeon]